MLYTASLHESKQAYKQQMKHIYYYIISFIGVIGYSQQSAPPVLSNAEWEKLRTNEAYHQEWLDETLRPGVLMTGDSISFSLEARKLMGNKNYRDQVYKDSYSFLDVQKSLIAMQLQKAFWQMIDLYPTHQHEVLQYIMAYKQVINTDQVLLGAFYTYAFFDPKITTIKDQKPVIHRPDIFEEKFRLTKEIIHHIKYYEKLTPQQKVSNNP